MTTEPTLLLLHGLGATAGLWVDVRSAIDWDGPVVAPDLPGHGTAPWTGDYTVPALASAVAAAVEPGRPVLIIGHSLGGVVGVELASGRYGLDVRGVVAVGVKVSWTDEDVAAMARVAERGVRWFDSRDEAVARFLRQSGLEGLVDDHHPAIAAAVVHDEIEGRWRVAQDPASFAQLPVDMAGLLDRARCPVILGAGEHDAMVSEAELAALVDAPRMAPGRGHNVAVEDPAWLVSLVAELRTSIGR